MSNTVEYDGILGEVNCVYMLADNTHVVLEGADENGFEVSKIDGTGVTWYARTIYQSQLKAGTITKAPIQLENGEAYQFDYCNGDSFIVNAIMRYRKSTDCFYFDNTTFKREYCANIIKLVPEEK